MLLFVLMGFLMVSSGPVMAQGPPPPPEGGHGLDSNQPANGGGAPIGGGLVLMLVMGAAWAGFRVYKNQHLQVK